MSYAYDDDGNMKLGSAGPSSVASVRRPRVRTERKVHALITQKKPKRPLEQIAAPFRRIILFGH